MRVNNLNVVSLSFSRLSGMDNFYFHDSEILNRHKFTQSANKITILEQAFRGDNLNVCAQCIPQK